METLKHDRQCYILAAIRPLTLWRLRLSTASTLQLSSHVIGIFFLVIFLNPQLKPRQLLAKVSC